MNCTARVPLYFNLLLIERVRILRRFDCARARLPLDPFRGDGGDRFANTFFDRVMLMYAVDYFNHTFQPFGAVELLVLHQHYTCNISHMLPRACPQHRFCV